MIKSATVSARIDERIKSEAEEIFHQLGIPVSAIINTLCHQIIIQKAIPFPMTLISPPPTLDGMIKEPLDAKLQQSYKHATPVRDARFKMYLLTLKRSMPKGILDKASGGN